jgi:hypothetical protein
MKAGSVKKQSIHNGTEKIKLLPIENELPLEAIIRFELRGRKVSAYLLRRGEGTSEGFQFIFGFETKGVHTTLRASQVDTVFDAIENGLKDIPPKEKLTIQFSSFSSDQQRQEELLDLCMKTQTPKFSSC